MDKPPTNVYQAAKLLGVPVFTMPLDNSVTSALIRNDKLGNLEEYFKVKNEYNSGWTIVINKSVTDNDTINFAIAHMLGHFVMHKKCDFLKDGIIADNINFMNSKAGEEYDAEATNFAVSLILPGEKVSALSKMYNPEQLAVIFDVSPLSIMLRLGLGMDDDMIKEPEKNNYYLN